MNSSSGKEKKKKHAVLITVLILVLLAVSAAGICLWIQHNSPVFFRKTTINGVDVSGLTPAQAMPLVSAAYSAIDADVRENGETVLKGRLADFGYTVDEDGLDELIRRALQMQGNDLIRLAQGIFNGNRFTLTVPYQCDEDQFSQMVSPSNLLIPRFPSEDARLSYREEEKEYAIVPEVYGNEMPEAGLREVVNEGLKNHVSGGAQEHTAVIEIPKELYILPEIKADDPSLVRQRDVYNRYCRSGVIYRFGTVTEALDWDTIRDWVIISDEYTGLDGEKLRAFVSRLAERYNTRYHDRTFHTSYGSDITIPGSQNEYGYTINEDAEADLLYENLESGQTVEREPVYYLENSFDNPYFYRRDGLDDLDGTYVEVSIGAQHLWFYKDGGLLMESDIVSGNVSRGNGTHTGVYPLAYKESPSVLVGTNANDGYRTEVTYWMPFTEGQGLHDATWRSSFGGSIYLSDGSHGCVNLPYWAAQMIYENIEAGTAIVIY